MEKMKPIFLPTLALPSHFECLLVFFSTFQSTWTQLPYFLPLRAFGLPTTPPFPGWLIPAHPPPAIWYTPNLQCKPNLHHTYTYFVHWCTLYIVPHSFKTASFLFERTPQLPFSAFSGPGLKTRLQRLTFPFHNSLGKVLEISVKAVDTYNQVVLLEY